MEGLKELVDPRFLLSQLVNVLILFIALYFLLWKRALNVFEERKQRIARGLEDAEKAQQKLAEAEQEYARRIEEAERERERILAQAKQEAGRVREEMLAEARAEAERIMAGAEETVELERQQMLTDLRGQVAALAVAAANRIIGEVLDEERQRRLIDEFFSGISAGRVQVLDEAEWEWAEHKGELTVSVISALPLSPEEQATVSRQLTAQLGREPRLEFVVDPTILGGLKIKVGDRIVDGSVAGRLSALEESLRA